MDTRLPSFRLPMPGRSDTVAPFGSVSLSAAGAGKLSPTPKIVKIYHACKPTPNDKRPRDERPFGVYVLAQVLVPMFCVGTRIAGYAVFLPRWRKRCGGVGCDRSSTRRSCCRRRARAPISSKIFAGAASGLSSWCIVSPTLSPIDREMKACYRGGKRRGRLSRRRAAATSGSTTVRSPWRRPLRRWESLPRGFFCAADYGRIRRR